MARNLKNSYPAEWKAISAAMLTLANYTCEGSVSYLNVAGRRGRRIRSREARSSLRWRISIRTLQIAAGATSALYASAAT